MASECDEQFHPSALASSTVRAGVVHSPRWRRPQSALASSTVRAGVVHSPRWRRPQSALASSTVRAGVVHGPRWRRPQSALACTLPWCNLNKCWCQPCVRLSHKQETKDRCLFRWHSTGVYQSGDQGTSHLKCVLSSSESGSRVQFSLKLLP